MKTIIFIFGSNPQISLAELEAVLGSGVLKLMARECAIAELPDDTDVFALQDRLGGIVKIGRIIGWIKENELFKTLKNYSEKENKYIFGISAYSAGRSERASPSAGSTVNFKAVQEKMKRIGLGLKKEFKAAGRRSRFVVSREDNLSSVAVVKNKLLTEGLEFLILAGANELILGKTLTVQDFEKYNLRDYGRPVPSPRSGMLPPKLAQMMINISKIRKDQTLLDPFCGSGTILQEAANLGIENIIGSDNEADAVSGSQKNLTWFQEEFKVKPRSLRIFQCDARKLAEKISADSIDVIAAEPYLGPPLTGREQFSIIQKNRDELEVLYAAAFQEFAKILKPGGVIVFVFPRFQRGQNVFEIRNLDQIKKCGFATEPLSENKRGSVVYQKDIQYLAREIFVFKKV
ncbi:methyltransferase domain-containing protein [Patescibacteria group bacterium]|nr:MAG: methyltransferase domain-containing protein [Patescibacteria group bacterium]